MMTTLVVFGATGDLTSRFLLPGLAQLLASGELNNITVLGAATTNWGDESFRRHAAAQLQQYAADVPETARNTLVANLHYRPVDVTDDESIAAIVGAAQTLQKTSDPVVLYLALPTGLMSHAISGLGAAELPAGSRIAVEKPFGENEQSARRLNLLLSEVLGPDAEQLTFRVDHALGMATLQNIIPLRFANRFPEVIWNSEHIAEIEVLWEETLALEGRADFYDRAGALRDVMQNHMMQVLTIAAMEGPTHIAGSAQDALSAEEFRRRKAELLGAVRILSPDQAADVGRRARYTAGTLADTGGAGGNSVPDYVSEAGVDPERDTETFAEVVLSIDTPRWSGTRFRLRAGKALAQRRKGIRVHLRPTGTSSGQQLWIGIDGPNTVSLSFAGLSPVDDAPILLNSPELNAELSPYAKVLRNLLSGRSELSVGDNEAELAWRILTPFREAWDTNLCPMETYAAGTSGPASHEPS